MTSSLRYRLPLLIPLASACLLVAPFACLAQAQGLGAQVGGEAQHEVFMSQAQRSQMLGDAVRRVQQSTGGQVLGAERVQFDGRDITRVKVMDERGRIRYMDEDPQDRGNRRRGNAPYDNEFESPRRRGDNPARP